MKFVLLFFFSMSIAVAHSQSVKAINGDITKDKPVKAADSREIPKPIVDTAEKKSLSAENTGTSSANYYVGTNDFYLALVREGILTA